MAKGLRIVLNRPEDTEETIQKVAAEFMRLREAGQADSWKIRKVAAAFKQMNDLSQSAAAALGLPHDNVVDLLGALGGRVGPASDSRRNRC